MKKALHFGYGRLNLVLILLFTYSFSNGQLIIPLDSIPSDIECEGTWTESGLTHTITEFTAGTGSCYFGIEDAGQISLWPARLNVDLSPLNNITMVEIDVNDFCGNDCTRAYLKDIVGLVVVDTGNVNIGVQTFTLVNATNADLSELSITSGEGSVLEIRIYHNTVGLEENESETTWTFYPNPGRAGDDLHIRSSDYSKWRHLQAIELIQSDGSIVQVLDMRAKPLTDVMTIPSSALPSGIFLVRLIFESEQQVYKIVR